MFFDFALLNFYGFSVTKIYSFTTTTQKVLWVSSFQYTFIPLSSAVILVLKI